MPEASWRYLPAPFLAVKISRNPTSARSIHPCLLSMPCQELQKKSQHQCRINHLGKLNVGVIGCCILVIRLWLGLVSQEIPTMVG